MCVPWLSAIGKTFRLWSDNQSQCDFTHGPRIEFTEKFIPLIIISPFAVGKTKASSRGLTSSLLSNATSEIVSKNRGRDLRPSESVRASETWDTSRMSRNLSAAGQTVRKTRFSFLPLNDSSRFVHVWNVSWSDTAR
jgi:hypothetical protein